MFRPRDSHDIRVLDTHILISPPARLRWLHDVFSNSVMLARFDARASVLSFESRIRLEHYGGAAEPDLPVDPFAETYPFCYPNDQIADLARTIERHYPDPDHVVDAWAKAFVHKRTPMSTHDLLLDITRAIRQEFTYRAREEHGTQAPVETLRLRSGSCRDYALFMMEVVRSLGFAARFVSGYLYDAVIDGGPGGMTGAGATHAWVQVFLPGAGWIEYDPTNGIVGGTNLIRIAVARDPSQAIPLQGTYEGAPDDYSGMEVSVTVTSLDKKPSTAAAAAPSMDIANQTNQSGAGAGRHG